MKGVWVVVSLLSVGVCVSSVAHGQTLPDNYKRSFIEGGVRGCMAKQRQDSLSKSLGNKKLREYCTCAMTRAADILTIQDLQYMFKTRDKSRFNAVMKDAGVKCMRELMIKWGYTK